MLWFMERGLCEMSYDEDGGRDTIRCDTADGGCRQASAAVFGSEADSVWVVSGSQYALSSDRQGETLFRLGQTLERCEVTSVLAEAGVPEGMMALDVGPETGAAIEARLRQASTLVWNGPLGAFEIEPFDKATVAAAQYAAAATKAGKLLTVAGGGDTVSALNHAGAAETFTYISTAGGAFLEWMEGKELPGVKALEG